ncbi:MAG: hypothetical protein PVS3B3_35250 [Ktedonobacteraceae bacterium]
MENQRWQPVTLVLNARLECKCGSLAVFVTGKVSGASDEYNTLNNVDVWCQDCFTKAQEEE